MVYEIIIYEAMAFSHILDFIKTDQFVQQLEVDRHGGESHLDNMVIF
jgi:hypothetical protein